MGLVVGGIKWGGSGGFDVKTPRCHFMSWVAWDKLLHQPGHLSLSVHICKMVGATPLGFGMMKVVRKHSSICYFRNTKPE